MEKTSSSSMKIGLFGGSFDPIHIGHLIIAETSRTDLSLDRILFIPVATPPHKDGTQMTSSSIRLEMVRAAIAENPFFDVSDVEIKRDGTSYTIDTVRQLRRQQNSAEFYLIIGGDSLLDLENWKDPDELLDEVPILVTGRPGFDTSHFGSRFRDKVTFVEMPLMHISSSEIRRRVRAGKSIRYYVPRAVETIITEKGLYQ